MDEAQRLELENEFLDSTFRGSESAAFRAELREREPNVEGLGALLVPEAGMSRTGSQPESRSGSSVPHQGGSHHAGSDNRAEHWSVVCRSCDRRGARCLWCVAGFG